MSARRRRWPLALTLLAVALLLSACAAGPGSRWAAPDASPAGFFAGIWHGMVVVFALIVSFFADQVAIYEPHNTGFGYDLGFVLGMLGAYSGGTHVTTKKRRNGG